MKKRTNWKSLKQLSDKDIAKAASTDPDAPLLSKEELNTFKPVSPTEKIDVKSIRERLGLSQKDFALFFGVSPRTIQEWEQHRKTPSATSRNFLKVVNYAPDIVQKALQSDL